MQRLCFISVITIFYSAILSQPDRWQQKVSYKMEIDFDVTAHQFTGTQKLVYYNNSPETLDRVFYHLYYNAFQPGSIMAVSYTHLDVYKRQGWCRISCLFRTFRI